MMNESFEDRIGKYLTGEVSLSEKEALEKEIHADPALRDQFLLYQKIWNSSHTEEGTSWNVENAWQKFNSEKQAEVPIKSKNRTRVLSWAVAAVLVLALGAAVFLWDEVKTESYAFSETTSGPLVLADGSKIYLNEYASVKVHTFSKKKRQLDLTGEAFFEISSDPSRPFIIKSGGTITEVLGTSFNIEQTADQTSIFVKTGKVIFRAQKNKNEAVALTSGEAAVFQDEKIERIVNPSANMHAWHSRELSFLKNMPFGAIIADISNYFGQDFTFENEKVKNCRVTIPLSFKEPELKSVLDAIVVPVNANYSFEGNKCIIKGGMNCN